MDTTRTFIAVFPPPDVVERIARALDALKQPGDGVGWVRPANIHYTLRFLGDLDASQVAAARRAAADAARAAAPFRVTLGAAGQFPNDRRPRILWLGAAGGAPALTALAAGLEAALLAEGLGAADKAFTPHLTLGRVRDSADGPAVATRFKAAEFPGDVFEVSELVVVKSTLDPKGAKYEPLAKERLSRQR